LVADGPDQVVPLGIVRVRRRVQGVEGDVAAAAGHADQEGGLHRAVGELAGLGVGAGLVLGQAPGIAIPGAESAPVDLAPGGGVEARIGKLAKSHGPGRGPKGQMAGVLPLVLASICGVGMIGRQGGILEVAGRVPVPRLADELQELVIAVAPVEPIGLLRVLGGAAWAPRPAAAWVVHQSPNGKPLTALVAAQHPPPVDEDPHPLLEDIGVEAVVAGGGLVPDLPPGPLRVAETRGMGMESVIAEQGRGVGPDASHK
jgi:hypothetical protein